MAELKIGASITDRLQHSIDVNRVVVNPGPRSNECLDSADYQKRLCDLLDKKISVCMRKTSN